MTSYNKLKQQQQQQQRKQKQLHQQYTITVIRIHKEKPHNITYINIRGLNLNLLKMKKLLKNS